MKIWNRSMDFVQQVYFAAEIFPTNEKFGLTSQIKRSAVSIPSNISEGAGRASNNQFRYFLEVAMGSCNEVQTQLELAFRFTYIAKEIFENLINEAQQIYRMILAFYNTLRPES